MSLSNYPENFDTNQNLYLVHDYLRLKLAEDYNPGDSTIYVTGNKNSMSSFPNAFEGGGVITLTDQCDDYINRSISFRYSSRTTNDLLDIISPWEFNGIEILDNFKDIKKYKGITNVCQNVIAQHHNSIKDALINIQRFAGIEGKIGNTPYQGTLEERINYLRKIVLGPRAWFSANKTLAHYPSEILFNDLSFSFGTDNVNKKTKYTWYFDLQKNNNGYQAKDENSVLSYEKLTFDDTVEVKYTYQRPGIYTVGLNLENDFGSDFLVFENMINIKGRAPDEAELIVLEDPLYQVVLNGSVRRPVGNVIELQVFNDGLIETGDFVTNYTWSIVDDLNHFNNNSTKCSFSVGGIYDVGLRIDTKYNSFRLTVFEDLLDIVEKTNLWLWTINNDKNSITNYEFGLISETFKTLSSQSIEKINDVFIRSNCNPNNYFYEENCRQLREFNRNNGLCRKNNVSSGDLGESLVYWASGRSGSHATDILNEKIHIKNFVGFTQTYSNVSINGNSYLNRPWNWVDFGTDYNLYFCFGKDLNYSLSTNLSISRISLRNLASNNYQLADSQYQSGADELKVNSLCEGWRTQDLISTNCEDTSVDWSARDIFGDLINNRDYYSSQRSVWKDGSGYLIRNEGQGLYFRFRPFYKTSGTSSNEFLSIRKLSNLSGPIKSEGELVSLSDGIFMFNNTGSISVFNTTTNVWATGGPGTNSSEFRFLQDVNKEFFDNHNQSLLAASDNDQVAYLSYDYSDRSFIKFSNVDLTFKYIGNRPQGNQWQLRFY
jgi:hypothetical protein